MKLQKKHTILIGSLLAIIILATIFTWYTLQNNMMPVHNDRITIMAPWMLTWTDDSAVYDYNSETHIEYKKSYDADKEAGLQIADPKDPLSIFVINRSKEAQQLKHSDPYKWAWAKTYNTGSPPENSPFTWGPGHICADTGDEPKTITLFKIQESTASLGGGGGRTAYICGDSYIVSDYINYRGEKVFGPYTIK